MHSCDVRFHETVDLIDSVDLKLITLPKNLLRTPAEGIDELVSSIREKGLIHPILVRPIGRRFDVVAGARRFEACRKLRWGRIPCIIRDVSDKNAYEISLIENIQRRTMNAVEEARAFKIYIENCGWGSESQLARKIGKSQEYVSQRISLLSLSDSVQQKIAQRELSVSVAREIATLKDPETRRILFEEAINQHLTVGVIREVTRSLKRSVRTDRELHESGFGRNAELKIKSEISRHSDVFDDPEFNDISEQALVRAQENGDQDADALRLRVIEKSILTLKLTLSRLGSLVEEISDKSEARDLLLEEKMTIHNMIDSLIKSKVDLGGRPQPLPPNV